MSREDELKEIKDIQFLSASVLESDVQRENVVFKVRITVDGKNIDELTHKLPLSTNSRDLNGFFASYKYNLLTVSFDQTLQNFKRTFEIYQKSSNIKGGLNL
jgi:hypothetical protein